MRMNRKLASVMGATIAAAVFAVACSDSATTAPRAAFVPKSSFAVGDATNNTPVAGEVKVCKTGTANGAFNVITDSASSAGTGGPTVIGGQPVAITSGTCVVAVIDNGDATQQKGDWFHVTEQDLPNITEGAPSCVGLEGPVSPASFFINNVHGVVCTFNNTAAPPPPPGNEGCTPGYWKQEQHFGSWAPVALNTTFTSVFGAGIYGGTLLQALGLNGGGINALIRHGAAAYLNAQNATVDYAYTTAQVIDIVQGDGAYAGLTIEERKNLLEAANQGAGGCPLDRAELAD